MACSPHRRTLNDPRWDRTPWVDLQRDSLLTSFEHDGPNQIALSRVCPHRPRSGQAKSHHRIERWDYSAALYTQPDYSNEPPSSWASTSRCNPALQREPMMAGEAIPLADW